MIFHLLILILVYFFNLKNFSKVKIRDYVLNIMRNAQKRSEVIGWYLGWYVKEVKRMWFSYLHDFSRADAGILGSVSYVNDVLSLPLLH